MNVNFAAYAKHALYDARFRHLTLSVVDHLHQLYPDSKHTERSIYSGRFALYNTNRLAGSWAVPVWISHESLTLSFSAPPIPCNHRITVAGYPEDVIKQVETPGGI